MGRTARVSSHSVHATSMPNVRHGITLLICITKFSTAHINFLLCINYAFLIIIIIIM